MGKKKAAGDARPRYIKPGSCTWCGHSPHAGACPADIRTTIDGAIGPCPCRRGEP